MRAAGVKEVGQVRSGDHLCLAFGTDEEQREVVADFMADGLSLGEKVVFVGDRSTADTASEWLHSHPGIASASADDRGRLSVRAAQNDFLPEGRFDPDAVLTALRAEVESVRREGFAGLRLAVEMSWALRGAPGSGHLPDYEKRLKEVCDADGVTGLCLYDRRLFDAGVMGYMTHLHPASVEANALHDDRRLRITRTFDPVGLRVSGAVDMTTVPALAVVLNQRVAAGQEDIHLDVSGLEFIDVAGLRAIVQAADGLQVPRVLRMANLAPSLRRVLSVVGWDQSPGLAFDDKAVSI